MNKKTKSMKHNNRFIFPPQNSILCLCLFLLSFTTGDTKSGYNVPISAVSISANDLDLDGDVDIVVGHNYNLQTQWSGTSILLNVGNGYFKLTDSIYLFGWQSDIASVNLNNNQLPEIVAKKENPDLETEYISIIYDNDYNNITDNNLNTYEGIGRIKTGDINGNNALDIVVASNLGKFWGVLYNDGTGNLSTPQYYSVSGFYPTDIACGDLNKDGRDDVVVAGMTEVFFSYPGGFQSLYLDVVADHIEICDFDNDGDLDMIGAKDLFPGNTHKLQLIENLGDEDFFIHDPVVFEPACHFYFATTDFNNDSLPDLLFHPMDHENLLVLYNDGGYTFSDRQFIPMDDYGEGTRRSACADFDGNGYNDIATIRSLGATLPANLNILFNNGEGNFVQDPLTSTQSAGIISQVSHLNCYPNPFRSKINIEYTLDTKCATSLDIYDLSGQKVKTLQNKILTKGNYKIIWDGMDDNRKEVLPGVYIICLVTGRQTHSCKLLYF